MKFVLESVSKVSGSTQIVLFHIPHPLPTTSLPNFPMIMNLEMNIFKDTHLFKCWAYFGSSVRPLKLRGTRYQDASR